MQSDYEDNTLQSYFTDVERLRDMFTSFVSMEKLAKRLIAIHGVGGVGKSSLLRMFHLHCRSEKIPVALASGDDVKSVSDVLVQWTEELKGDGIKFPAFSRTLESYHAIQARVGEQAKKSQNKAAEIASKAASKTAETAGGALLGAAIGSVIPGLGTAIGSVLGGVVSGMGAEAVTDWLRGFLSKPDIELLLDPAKRLSADFLEDSAKAAEKKRAVLLLDTFEQMSVLEGWAGEVAQRLHPNVLMVIAGRKLPDWDRVWPDWMMSAQVEELKPMTEDVMRALIQHYYATLRGGEPDPAQVEAIIRFAQGLPIVVTSAVQLWVKYGVEDFQSVKAEIVANLVDLLMEGVPEALLPALEAAAVVRWFDQPILRAVMQQEDVREVYRELRRFPFVRTRVEGRALHDSVREMVDENMRVQDSERHAALHGRAAAYFEERLKKVADAAHSPTGGEAERLGLERLYHYVRADETEGIQLFQKMAEELAQSRLFSQLRTLIKDVNTYPLEHELSLQWRSYYEARLQHATGQISEAEKTYQALIENQFLDDRLRAYALSDLARIWTHNERLVQKGGVERALAVLERSRNLLPQLDPKLALNFTSSRSLHLFRGEIDKAVDALNQQYQYYRQINDMSGIVNSLDALKDTYGLLGNWREAGKAAHDGLRLLESMPATAFLHARLTGHNVWYLIWSGQYWEAEKGIEQALLFAQQAELTDSLPELFRDLGFVLGLQRRWELSEDAFAKSTEMYKERGEWIAGLGGVLGFCGLVETKRMNLAKASELLNDSLNAKLELKDNNGIPEIFVWLGEMCELRAGQSQGKDVLDNLSLAEYYFDQALKYRWTRRRYFECNALTGIARVRLVSSQFDTLSPVLSEAEKLAQQYEYSDHLASLRLTQGHLALGNGDPEEALDFYQQAMIHALRYNRFLLDELIGGRSQGTPLRPIIPYCLDNHDLGKRILLRLLDWWKSSVNDIGTPRRDSISPLPEGIPLFEAEKRARARELGDGSEQRTVVEQLEAAVVS